MPTARNLSGVRFEREIYRSAKVDGVTLVKLPVATSSSRRFAGGGYVDFIGAIHGVPVAIEAKCCHNERFYLGRISKQQLLFLERWNACGGVAVVLVKVMTRRPQVFLLTVSLLRHWLQSGKRSVLPEDWKSLPVVPRVDGRWAVEKIPALVEHLLQ